jgi:hypothetical protein
MPCWPARLALTALGMAASLSGAATFGGFLGQGDFIGSTGELAVRPDLALAFRGSPAEVRDGIGAFGLGN